MKRLNLINQSLVVEANTTPRTPNYMRKTSLEIKTITKNECTQKKTMWII